MSEVTRICSIITFYLSKLWKAKFSILFGNISDEAAGEIWHWSLRVNRKLIRLMECGEVLWSVQPSISPGLHVLRFRSPPTRTTFLVADFPRNHGSQGNRVAGHRAEAPAYSLPAVPPGRSKELPCHGGGGVRVQRINRRPARWGPTLSLPRVINFKFLLQPHQKYYIAQYGELGFS